MADRRYAPVKQDYVNIFQHRCSHERNDVTLLMTIGWISCVQNKETSSGFRTRLRSTFVITVRGDLQRQIYKTSYGLSLNKKKGEGKNEKVKIVWYGTNQKNDCQHKILSEKERGTVMSCHNEADRRFSLLLLKCTSRYRYTGVLYLHYLRL